MQKIEVYIRRQIREKEEQLYRIQLQGNFEPTEIEQLRDEIELLKTDLEEVEK